MTTRVEYPISAGYCENWGMAEILRELIANALDSRAPYQVFYDEEKGEAVIRDEGRGFKAHCLMLGEGEKKDGAQIGQFKEGLKIALLAAARAEIPVTLRTTGCSIESVGMEQLGLGRKGLVLYLNGNRLACGTEVRIRCAREELLRAKELFLAFGAGAGGPVPPIFVGLDQQQKVYVNGLQTAVGGWAFSYNLRGAAIKGAMNRDRSVLSYGDLRDAVSSLWFRVSDPKMIRLFLNRVDNADGEDNVWVNQWPPHVRRRWTNAIMECFGLSPKLRKVAVSGSNEHNLRLRQLGWHLLDASGKPAVVRNLTHSLFPAAHNALGNAIMTAERKNTTKSLGVYRRITWAHLPTEVILDYETHLNNVLSRLWQHLPNELHQRLFNAVDRLRWFVYSHSTLDGDNSAGCWLPDALAVGVRRDQLMQYDLPGLDGLFAHELAHFLSGATDGEEEFERMLTMLLACLLRPKPIRPPVSVLVDVIKRVVRREPTTGLTNWQEVRAKLQCMGMAIKGDKQVLGWMEAGGALVNTHLMGYQRLDDNNADLSRNTEDRGKRLLFLDGDGVTRTIIRTHDRAQVASIKRTTKPVMTGEPFFWVDRLGEV